MRLIDADALIVRAKKLDSYAWTDFCSIVDEAPTIKTKPVRHGRWSKTHTGCCKCSICGQYEPYTRCYCPYCGARMDGGEQNAE